MSLGIRKLIFKVIRIVDCQTSKFTHFRLKKISPNYILEESNFNFRYVWLCDQNIPREKWLNYLQTVKTLIRRRIPWHLIWVSTVYQLSFWVHQYSLQYIMISNQTAKAQSDCTDLCCLCCPHMTSFPKTQLIYFFRFLLKTIQSP